jgi:hypothetical protein
MGRRALGVALCALCALAALCGCSLASDFDVHQCRHDADCTTLDGQVRLCEHERCTAGCTSNEQCSAADPERQICPSRGRECVGLKSEGEECFVDFEYDGRSMGPLRGEDLALIGAFAAREPYQSPLWKTYQLAARELNAQGGVPGPAGGQPVLLAVCDSAAERVAGGLEHLIQALGVRAIVAELEPDALSSAFGAVRREDGTVVLAPHPGGASGVEGSSWYIPENALDAGAYLGLVARMARRRGPLRLASLVSDAAEDQQIAVAVAQSFQQAGADGLVAENENYSLADDPAARSAALARLARFEPQLVLVFASGSHPAPSGRARLQAVREIEDGWPSAAPRPYYVLSSRNLGEPLSALSEDPSFPERVIEVATERASPAAFAPALPFAAPREREELLRAYDAVYYSAYALSLSRLVGGTAPDVAAALQSLVAPNPNLVQVGPGAEGLERAIALLDSGTAFQLLPTTELPSPDASAEAPALSSSVTCPLAAARPGSEGGVAPALAYDPARADFVPAAVVPACLEGAFGGSPE